VILKILSALANAFTILSFWKKENKTPVQKTTNKIKSKGKHNTVYQGNTINTHIGDVYNTQETATCIVEEVSRIPYSFRGKHISIKWFGFTRIISAMLLVLYLYISFKTLPNSISFQKMYAILIPSLVLSIVFATSSYRIDKLNRYGLYLNFFGHLIANHGGKLYKVKYTGKCNRCGGKIEIQIINGSPKAVCQIYSDDHIDTFSPRIFDENYYA
jgi:hypothetical protein